MYNNIRPNLSLTCHFLHSLVIGNCRICIRSYTPSISFTYNKVATHKRFAVRNPNLNIAKLVPLVKLSDIEIETINNGFWEKNDLVFTGRDTLLKGKLSDLDKYKSINHKNKNKNKNN